MKADGNDEILHNVITNAINQFAEKELKEMQSTELCAKRNILIDINNQNILIIHMHNHEDIIKMVSSSTSDYSEIHLSFCP